MEDSENKNVITDITDLIINEAYNLINWSIIVSKNPDVSSFEELESLGVPGDYFDYDHDTLNNIIDLVRPLLKNVSLLRKIDAQNASDVLRLLGTGKISIDDSLKLMNLLKGKSEIDEIALKNSLISDLKSLVGE